MEFRQLRYFKFIADARSFVRGSHQLRVAQPALSRAIAKLEAELGQVLFERHSGGVSLTDAGTVLYEHAASVLRSVQGITDVMSAGLDKPHGPLSFGAPPSMQYILTAPVAAEFLKSYPEAPLSLIQEPSLPLRTKVESGQLDLAVISTMAPTRGLHVTPLCTIKLCIICRREDRQKFGASAQARDLMDRPLILSGFPNTLNPYLTEAFATFDSRPNICCEVNTGTLVVDLVAEGAGVGVTAWGMVPPSRAAELDMVPIDDLETTLVIITSYERRGSAAVRRMTQMLTDRARQAISSGAWPWSRLDETSAGVP